MYKRAVDFIRAIFLHKRALFSITFLVLLFSTVPLQFAQANIFSDILGLVSNIWLAWSFGIPLALITAVLLIGALLAIFLSALLVSVVKFFIVASLSIPILPGSGISVVDVGWAFSRDIVNLVFILILVFIGLATILRIQNYQAQKALPLLIIVALLVNFSGVFVAFIVDIANLVTNVFVSQLGGFNMAVDGSLTLLTTVGKNLAGVVLNITSFGSILVPALTAAIFLIFYVVFAIIMFLVALLIIVRVGILWALTILAPIAFAAYILPVTRPLWSQWLKQLIQWSIIGIPIAFFLWLAQEAAAGATSIKNSWVFGISTDCYNNVTKKFVAGDGCLSGGVDPGLMDVIASLMGPMTALLLVLIGVMVSMQFAPAGANQVIKLGQTLGMKGVTTAGSAVWRKAGRPLEKFGENIRKRGQGKEVPEEEQTGLERMLGNTPGMGASLGVLGRLITKPTDREALEEQLEKRRADEARINELRAKGERESALTDPNTGNPIMVSNLTTDEKNELDELNENLDPLTEQELIAEIEAAPKTRGAAERMRGIARFGVRSAGRGLEVGSRKLTELLHTKDSDELASAMRSGTNQDPEDNMNRINLAVLKKDWNTVVGLLVATMGPNGDTDEIRKGIDGGKLQWKTLNKAFQHAEQHGDPTYYRVLLKGFLDKMLDGTIQAQPHNQANIWEKIRPEEIVNETVDINSIADTPAGTAVLDQMFEKAETNVVTALIGRHPKKSTRQWAARHAESLGANWFVDRERADVLTAILSSGGRSLGIPLFNGLGRNEVAQMVLDKRGGETTEQLRDRKALLELTLSQPGAQNKSKLQREIAGIDIDLTLRDQTVNPTARILNKMSQSQQEIANFNAISTNRLTTANYVAKGQADQQLNLLTRELRRRDISPTPTPLAYTPYHAQETDIIRTTARARHAAQDPSRSPKPVSEYEQDVKREYEQKYRRNILAKLEQEEEQLWLQGRAQRDFGGNQALATSTRFKEIYDSLEKTENLPSIAPAPQIKEVQEASAIAKATKDIPKRLTKQSLRKVQLAEKESLAAIEQQEQEVKKIIREIKLQTSEGASAAILQELDTQVEKQETFLKGLRDRQNDLYSQEINIKAAIIRP